MVGSSNDPGLESISLDDGDEINAEVANRCLIGKILAPKQLNKQAVSTILHNAWKVRASFSISPWNDNLFLFNFDEIHGLPLGKLTKTNGEIIGRRIGQLITVDTFGEKSFLHKNYLHIRVALDITKPLPRGFRLQQGGHTQRPSSAVWISFKFEKLSDFCFDCGTIGHDRQRCKFVSREVGRVFGYGPKLRTGITKSIGRAEDSHRHKVLDPTSPTGGACGTATSTDTSEAQARITVPGDQARLAAYASEEVMEPLEGVEVRKDSTHSFKKLPDNHPTAHMGLSISMGPSLTLSPLLNCGPGLEGQLSAGLVLSEPGPMTPAGLQYFVTKPNDRPLDPSLRPILLNPYSSRIGIKEISPSSSPTCVDLKTKVLDECMSCVFNSLTLKLKA
ncbi:hypothetical protein ACSBR2_036588 [Camellia fascicularis]